MTAPLPPLALYVHLPWCVRKCPYCDFNSHEGKGPLPESAYVDALLRDLDSARSGAQGRRIESVFIGGGTPSLFSGESVRRLLDGVRALVPFSRDAEITLEANPGTVESGRFRDYRAAGVNRISLGVQSFDDAQLRTLGRIHDAREARAAIDTALESFQNVNLDLMYVLPGQDVAGAARDAASALAAGVQHLSFYHLTIEPNTAFGARPPRLPDPDEAAEIEDAVHESLAAAGYARYEVSAWARPGRECRHNLNYWRFGDYLGIGAGAHSKLSAVGEGGGLQIVREARTRAPADYLSRLAPARATTANAVTETREVGRADLVFEFMMNALRLTDGVPVSLFAAHTGLPLSAAQSALATATSRGLVTLSAGRIAPTELGLRFLNDLLGLFLP
jgi:oxygen-independent coproporphyrinogen-3 oxidase